MNRRGIKRALTAATVTALATVGLGMATTPAGAASTNNNGATVGGVRGVPATGNPSDCPRGNLCLYTGRDYSGTMFPLYNCGTYNLYNWNGFGSVANNQTGGAVGTLYNRNWTVNLSISPGTATPSWDYAPIWFARPC
ncbi:peptidase inhibitor family I36 protein [Streptomyces sp. NPDC029044]|uniref:peptidase inhibitor family I36 protein n=1 Tax=Streptomyces sp. NPDC029044 TaxID=3157198 RepID=UPI0033E6E127